MRATEFIPQYVFEDAHEDPIKSQLMTLLTTLHASNIPSVSMQQIQKSLEDAGYFVPNKWIRDHAQEVKIVRGVEDGIISFDLDDESKSSSGATPPEQDQGAEKVEKMARKALGRRKP